jgi:hypothetical protein
MEILSYADEAVNHHSLECTFENIFGHMTPHEKCALLSHPCGELLEFINFF